MDDPTIADVAAALAYLTKSESRIPEEAELNEVRKAIQKARMKTASAPCAFIMSVNMNGSASNRGTAVDRRMLLKIIMRNFFSSLIFCQELPGCFKKEVVDECGTGGYEYVATGNQASVLWLAQEFYGEPVKTTDSSIDKILRELKERSDIDVSELRGRVALVKLTKIGEEASGCQPFLAASWHGPYKGPIVARKKVCKGLFHFLRKVCNKEKVSSFIIGGDFNMNTLHDIDLEDKMFVPMYELTSRAESKSKEGTNYIAYKDNFIVLNERCDSDISVSSVRPIEFENSTDLGSDITKQDHQKFNEGKQSQDTERKDLLDHDPIVGVLSLTGKRTGECKVEIMHDLLFSTSDGLVSPPVNLKYHSICLQSFKVVSSGFIHAVVSVSVI